MKLRIEFENKMLEIKGDYSTYDEASELCKAILSFLSFDAEGVFEHIKHSGD